MTLRVCAALEERKQPRTLFTFVFWWDVLNCKEGMKQKQKNNKCSMLTTLSRNWVKVNHFVPWRQCLRFHPQQTHFHSGCSFEVIQVLAVSDGRDGLSTNSIYSIMWQSKKHFFLCFFNPHSPVQILPSYLPPWQASVLLPTALSPLLLQLYCYPFFFYIDFLYDSYPSFSCMLRFPLLTVAHRAACLVKRML